MNRLLQRLTLVLVTISLSYQYSHAQEYKIFQDAGVQLVNTDDLFISPQVFRTINLDADIFAQKISNIPHEIEVKPINSATVLTFPLPDGTEEEFRIVEYSMMESGLAAAFSSIKTYLGVGVKNPLKTVRFDYSSHGLRAVLRLGEEMVYIDPVDKSNSGSYVCYYRKDLLSEEAHTCHTIDDLSDDSILEIAEEGSAKSSNCGFQQYRLAVAATAEYSAHFDATSSADEALVLSAITTSINRVNEIFERDLGIRLVLVNNMEGIFYYDASTDPYTNNSASAMLDENQTNIPAVIGLSNFDIGHVFSTSFGGIASVNSPCRDSYKAKGVTGSNTPQGDAFDIDLISHEIGHQFGARHTFNNYCSGNVTRTTSVEPGSGSTIMSYSGICSPNIVTNSDAYFHAVSMSQINAFISGSTGSSCSTPIASSNNQPEADAGENIIIPSSTPFYLEGIGTDTDGDALTFCWEQMDVDSSAQSPVNTSVVGPNFRSFLPSADNIRYFPNLSDLSSGSATTWEVLSAVSRDFNFRLTVRDNSAAAGGCFAYDDMTVSVDAAAGPFLVTAPNSTGISWIEGSRQTVTWDVANTDASPINCSKVDILLSYDGGLSYPTTLVTNVDNDGSIDVTIPEGTTTTAKIMVKSIGNVFFDISDNDFTIAAGSSDFSLSVQNPDYDVCGGADAVYDITVGSISGFSESIMLNLSGAPAGVSTSFSSNPVNSGETIQLTISGTSNATVSDYILTLNGASQVGGTTSTPKSIDFLMKLGEKPGNAIQTAPTNNETGVVLRPSFSWNAATLATKYELQVSTDPTFATIAQSAETTSLTFTLLTDLESATSYFWRVRGLTDCGGGDWSPPLIFTTYYCSTYVQNTEIDVNDGGDVYSDLTINDAGSVISVEVLNIIGTHVWVSDLTATLISPATTEVTLWSSLCSNTNDFSLSLKDNATNTLASITCEPLGGGQDYQPAGSLSDFSSESTTGTWRLKLNDTWAGDPEIGKLQTWSLNICTEDYVPAEDNALPLELLSFRAKAQTKTILLDWEVTDEKDISGYEIERSEIGSTNFQPIGFVSLQETQDLINEYRFEDKFVEKGIVYQYRLRILDYSGEITYSEIRKAQITKGGDFSLNIYPNPAHNTVSIEYLGGQEEDVEIEIIDIAGKKVANYSLRLGTNVLDISNFSNGIYIIKTIGEHSLVQQKLVVN